MSGTASVPTQFQAAVTATGLQLDQNFNTIVGYLNDPTNRVNYGTDGGSTNTLVINPSPAVVGGYSAGLTITFRAAFSNSGAVVANVSGLGNASVLDQQQRQLTASAIVSGSVYQMAHNGTSAFNLLSPNAARAGAPLTTVYSSPGTFTFTAASGVAWALIEAMGGGGSGGAATSTGSTDSRSGGGGGGAYGWTTTSNLPATATLTVGAGGANGNGGASAFGLLITAGGGLKGTDSNNASATSGGLGGTCTGATLNGIGPSGFGVVSTVPGHGANTHFGGGGQGSATTSSVQGGKGFGAGGSGVYFVSGSGSDSGGTGAPGIIIVRQYFA